MQGGTLILKKNKTKKILLFIVEGQTDRDTLSPILKKIFTSEEILFDIIRYDITSEKGSSQTNISKKIVEKIKKYLQKNGLSKSDIIKVIQITDTDGAYIDDKYILDLNVNTIQYTLSNIETNDVQNIKDRNKRKLTVTNQLISKKVLYGIEYGIYYMSRNLEHLFHNKVSNLNDEFKTSLSDFFVKKYEDDIDGFLDFICNSEFSVHGDYNDTWDFIKKDTNSLNRYTNLNLIFENENM